MPPRPTAFVPVLVGADDRTGALETAGVLADAVGRPVPVRASRDPDVPAGHAAEDQLVVDLDSRHVAATTAAARARELGLGVRSLHKIDSVLRGNWAVEVLARGAPRVLVVAAAPLHGRTCVGGVVRVHGVAVDAGPAGRDPRSPVRSARPADHLREAGAAMVETLATVDDVGRWLRAGDDPSATHVAVADARTSADVVDIVARWDDRSDGVLLAGPAAVLGAAALRLGPPGPEARTPSGSPGPTLPGPMLPGPMLPGPMLPGPMLVVCGSLHPTARRQIETLAASGLDAVIETTDPSTTGPTDGHLAVAVELADRARIRVATGRFATVVVIGGDTAAAVLGPSPRRVGGTLAPGMAWLHDDDPAGPLVLTRSGGFGDDSALVDVAIRLGTPTVRRPGGPS